MKAHLRAGIAIFNAGGHHGAHDAWEEHWLELDPDTDDEQFLHGLIQYTAAIFHARNRNWSGATGLAESGQKYLAGLPDDYRNVNVDEVRSFLDVLERDPEVIERRHPVSLRHEGRELRLADLGFEATTIAATVLAEEREHHTGDTHLDRDESELIERAIQYARDSIDASDTSSEKNYIDPGNANGDQNDIDPGNANGDQNDIDPGNANGDQNDIDPGDANADVHDHNKSGRGVFPPLLFDYVREPANREIVLQRLAEHVDLRASREADVEGLFEARDSEPESDG